MAAQSSNEFTFEISLSVLNHLGRNLYRNFMTVLGEAISNSWDANANNVWISIDRANGSFVVKDDGDGMDDKEFQERFLKIGYSKRKAGSTTTNNGRPYIGRKGIGKLALLSCAKRISVLTKKRGGRYTGGKIDNSGLDAAIVSDLTPDQYRLDNVDVSSFGKYTENHEHGTIISFEETNDGIRNSTEYLKRLIALYFRFSLLDQSFVIHVDGQPVTLENLSDLAGNTQIVWVINELKDPFLDTKIAHSEELKKRIPVPVNAEIRGFIGSVVKPSNLKIPGTEEKVTVDLFVNGRLREKDIIKHIPTTRVVESYLYGQVHFNDLDDDVDRFASSREGIVADDPKFKIFLGTLRDVLAGIMNDWDKTRRDINQDGDPENTSISRKERKSRELFNVVSEDYSPPKGSPNQDKVSKWVSELAGDAEFNFASYADCFISENLVRKYIDDKKIPLSSEALAESARWKNTEAANLGKANMSIPVRRVASDMGYLAMGDLANLVDKVKDPNKEAGLSRDATEYKPIRDALAHTALLTEEAKRRLRSVYDNIRSRVRALIQTP